MCCMGHTRPSTVLISMITLKNSHLDMCQTDKQTHKWLQLSPMLLHLAVPPGLRCGNKPQTPMMLPAVRQLYSLTEEWWPH